MFLVFSVHFQQCWDLFEVTLSLIFFNLASKSVFFTKLLIISGILFSTAVNAELVAKPVTIGILPSISVILVLRSVYLTNPLTFLFTPLVFFLKSDPYF